MGTKKPRIKERVAELRAKRDVDRDGAKERVLEVVDARQDAKAVPQTLLAKIWTVIVTPFVFCGFCCCGTPRRKKMTCIVSAALLAMLGAFGGIGYAYDFWLNPPAVDAEFPSIRLKSLSINPGGKSFSINVDVTLNLYNPNYFGADVMKAKLSVFYADALIIPGIVKDILLGNSTLKETVSVGADSWTKLPLHLSLINSAASSAVLGNVVKDCALDGKIKFNFYLYDIRAKVWFIHFSVDSVRFSAELKCP